MGVAWTRPRNPHVEDVERGVRAEPVRPADEARVSAELAEGLRDCLGEVVR